MARQVKLSTCVWQCSICFWRFSGFWTCICSWCFLVRPCSECRWAALAFPRISGSLLDRRRGRINARGFCRVFLIVSEDLSFRDLSAFPFLIGRSASWRDSVSVRLDSPVLERRRGRLHPREFHGILLLVCGGLQVCENVGFLVCSEAGVPARWMGHIQNGFAAIYFKFSTLCSTIG